MCQRCQRSRACKDERWVSASRDTSGSLRWARSCHSASIHRMVANQSTVWLNGGKHAACAPPLRARSSAKRQVNRPPTPAHQAWRGPCAASTPVPHQFILRNRMSGGTLSGWLCTLVKVGQQNKPQPLMLRIACEVEPNNNFYKAFCGSQPTL